MMVNFRKIRIRKPPTYFSRARRVGGKVKRDYIGKIDDPEVALLFRLERMSQIDRCTIANADETTNQLYRTAIVELKAAREQTRLVANCLLVFDGITLTKTWLVRSAQIAKGNKMTQADFQDLLSLSEQGNEKAQASLCEIIDMNPRTFRPFGDLTNHVRAQLLELLAKDDVLSMQSILLNLSHLRKRFLSRSQSSPALELLLDQLELNYLDVRYRQLLANEPSITKKEAKFRQKELAAANKRYEATLVAIGSIWATNSSTQPNSRDN